MRAILLLALLTSLGCGTAAPTTAPKEKEKGATAATGTIASTFPPDDWTHKELAAHLAKKGVNLTVHAAGLPFTAHGLPVAFLHEPPDVGQPGVLVYLCRDRQHAREFAGTMGVGAMTFGRFAIGLDRVGREGIDDPTLLLRVSKALN